MFDSVVCVDERERERETHSTNEEEYLYVKG